MSKRSSSAGGSSMSVDSARGRGRVPELWSSSSSSSAAGIAESGSRVLVGLAGFVSLGLPRAHACEYEEEDDEEMRVPAAASAITSSRIFARGAAAKSSSSSSSSWLVRTCSMRCRAAVRSLRSSSIIFVVVRKRSSGGSTEAPVVACSNLHQSDEHEDTLLITAQRLGDTPHGACQPAALQHNVCFQPPSGTTVSASPRSMLLKCELVYKNWRGMTSLVRATNVFEPLEYHGGFVGCARA